jgi:hypothetical protein
MTIERPTSGALLEVDGLQLGPIGTNCYLVRESGSTAAFVVDPGDDADRIVALATERGLKIEAILVTHCHWDHIGGVAALAAATGAPVWMNAIESQVLEDPDSFPNMGPKPIEAATVDHKLEGGERIEVAGIAIDVLHTPGHSPGHLTFVVDGIRDASGDGFDCSSAPMVVAPPCPDSSTVSAGSRATSSSRLFASVGPSANGRSVRPTEPWKMTSPTKATGGLSNPSPLASRMPSTTNVR